MLGSFFQTYSLNMKLFSFRFHQLWWPALWHAQCALPSFTEFVHALVHVERKCLKKRKRKKETELNELNSVFDVTFFCTEIIFFQWFFSSLDVTWPKMAALVSSCCRFQKRLSHRGPPSDRKKKANRLFFFVAVVVAVVVRGEEK